MARKIVLLAALILIIGIVGCTSKSDYPESPEISGESSCVTCHTSQETLELVAEPDTTGGDDSGEG